MDSVRGGGSSINFPGSIFSGGGGVVADIFRARFGGGGGSRIIVSVNCSNRPYIRVIQDTRYKKLYLTSVCIQKH